LTIETPIFTAEIDTLLSPDEYQALQQALLLRPDAGTLIPGSRGLRKLRWGVRGTGKRGGLRVIYYWDIPAETLYLLLVYRKSRQEDLTPAQLKFIQRLLQEELG
jgi:mRNA-degrading endonuclease RelE of RelBE toxin-antitoxin system